MIDFLKEKGEQLLDTLLEPLWQWVLKLSWTGRALVLLIGSGIAYFIVSPDAMLSAFQHGWRVTRVLMTDNARIPIDRGIHGKISETILRLSTTLEPDLELPNKSAITPRPLAQSTLALANNGITKTLDANHLNWR